jgi:predicted nuclease of predicted toxin-antitoxin system
MMRVLLDQGLAPRAAAILRDHDWDAVHVSEIEMQAADDADILNLARNTDRICITLDHDFHAHLAFTKAGLPSVVLLRVQGLDGAGQAALIRVVCDVCREALAAGAAVSADTATVRIRRLPLK